MPKTFLEAMLADHSASLSKLQHMEALHYTSGNPCWTEGLIRQNVWPGRPDRLTGSERSVTSGTIELISDDAMNINCFDFHILTMGNECAPQNRYVLTI